MLMLCAHSPHFYRTTQRTERVIIQTTTGVSIEDVFTMAVFRFEPLAYEPDLPDLPWTAVNEPHLNGMPSFPSWCKVILRAICDTLG